MLNHPLPPSPPLVLGGAFPRLVWASLLNPGISSPKASHIRVAGCNIWQPALRVSEIGVRANPCLRALGPWGRRRLLGHGGAQGGAGWLQVWRVQLADKRIKRIRTEKGPRLGGIKTRIGGIETQYMQALRGSYIECSTHYLFHFLFISSRPQPAQNRACQAICRAEGKRGNEKKRDR